MTQENTLPTASIAAAAPELTGRQKLWLIGLVIMKRVRFIAILAGVGLFIVQWDNVKSHWDRWTHPRATASRELPPDEEFFCSMDPQVVRTTYEPNGDVPACPICGMPLSIRAKGQKEELPAGITGRVRLSPERIQMAGIKTVAVDYRPIVRQTRTVGYVTYDETRLSRVVSRVGGYVEKLFVNKTFTMVHKGDRLVEIDSPELYSAAKELIQAERFGVSREVADREKLLLLGFSEGEVREIAAAKEPPTRLVIRAPQSGFVVEKKIVAGASVEPKMTLLEIADLSSVWVEAEVYESDIAFLQPGQKVEATVEAYPNRTFTGEVASIYPRVEATTRTNRIRVQLENPNNELRPGMYAAVTINTPLETIEPYRTLAAKTARTIRAVGWAEPRRVPPKSPRQEFLVVPEQAVVDTGAKKIVYVQRKEGLFEGVEVELGPRQNDFYPVLKGLTAGDQVVAAGGFLVDAETRLNPAAASTYFGASGGPQSGSSPPPIMQKQSRDKVTEARPTAAVGLCEDDIKNIEQLPQEDWQAAKAQGICPVTETALGSMGVPVKITLRGKTVFLCCKSCIGKAKRDPEGILKKLEK
ncbi:MAG: efflux RND transporter periplasmic adaptor subunit [Thermoguttaceae bacterium]